MSTKSKRCFNDFDCEDKGNQKGNANSMKDFLSSTTDIRPFDQLCFTPFADKYGEATATLTVGLKDKVTNTFLTKSDLTMRMIIANVNDRPKITKLSLLAPVHLSYEKSSTNLGYLVSQLLTSQVASDTDSTGIGKFVVWALLYHLQML